MGAWRNESAEGEQSWLAHRRLDLKENGQENRHYWRRVSKQKKHPCKTDKGRTLLEGRGWKDLRCLDQGQMLCVCVCLCVCVTSSITSISSILPSGLAGTCHPLLQALLPATWVCHPQYPVSLIPVLNAQQCCSLVAPFSLFKRSCEPPSVMKNWDTLHLAASALPYTWWRS